MENYEKSENNNRGGEKEKKRGILRSIGKKGVISNLPSSDGGEQA